MSACPTMEVTPGRCELELDVGSLEGELLRKSAQRLAKRAFDILGAALCLLSLSPVFVLLALLVRISSKGPIIFSQPRVGYRGKLFAIHKFRTMHTETTREILKAEADAAAVGLLVKGKNDARVTTVGRWLRATSLDELPQLLNVLKGDMSLVGPRPLVPFMLVPHPQFAHARSLVRPGITGLWQISARHNNTHAAAMMPYDLDYLRQFSLRLDARILLQTPRAVLTGAGAC